MSRNQVSLCPWYRLFEYDDEKYIPHDEHFEVGTPVMLAEIQNPFSLQLESVSKIAQVSALDFEQYIEIKSAPACAYLANGMRPVTPPEKGLLQRVKAATQNI